MNLSVLERFIMFRIITRSVVARQRTGATDSAPQRAGATDSRSSCQCWWSTRLSLAVDDACVMVVQCPRLFRKPLSLGTPLAEPAKAAPFCKACRNVAKLGNQNGQAHLRVWPCTWVRKAPAPRKKRAADTPIAVAENSSKVAVDEGNADADGTAKAVSLSSASALWE